MRATSTSRSGAYLDADASAAHARLGDRLANERVYLSEVGEQLVDMVAVEGQQRDACRRCAALDPSDDSLPPGVDEANRQREDKEANLGETEPSNLLEDYRPAKDEDDIHIEGDEEQREDIEGERELHPAPPIGVSPDS